jgi:hypothetical protein
VREYLNVTTNVFFFFVREFSHYGEKNKMDFFFFFSGKFEKNGKIC